MSTSTRPAIPLPVLAISLGLPLLLWGAVSVVRLHLEAGEQYAGIFRYDMFYYLANAREVLESGNGIFYDNPFSAAFDGPRVYSHLQLVLFGWIWWLFGVPLPLLWEIGQVVFGTGMFLMLWRLLGSYFPDADEGGERLVAFAVLAVGGGGLAIQSAIVAATSPAAPPFMEVFRFFTAGMKGPAWLPNVFQNAAFTTEAWYHLLSLGTLSCLARGQRGLALTGVLLTWWSHPFTGLELGAIVGAAAVVEAGVQRDAKSIGFAACVAVVSSVFLLYYVVLIPYFSIEAAYILEHWRVDETLFRVGEAWSMWGLFLVGPLFLLRPSSVLRLKVDAADRMLLAWIVVVLVLILHDLLLPSGVDAYQPLHFTRGYLFIPMGILGVRGAAKLTRSWPARRRALAAAGLVALVSLDNAVYTLRLSDHAERPVLSAELLEISEMLERETPPTNVLVDGQVPLLAAYLPIVTPHRVYLTHSFLTPFHPQKSAAVSELIGSGDVARGAARLGIGFIVGTSAVEQALAPDLASGRARLALATGPYRVVEVLLPKLPQAPGPPAAR